MTEHSAPADAVAGRDPALALPLAERAGWDAWDVRTVDTARLLAADAVQKAGNGHPGTATSLAPLGYLLFHQVMRHDPADDQWLGPHPPRRAPAQRTGPPSVTTRSPPPGATLAAFAEHGMITGDTVRGNYSAARAHLDTLEQLGIGYQGRH